jgi:hypothetical protein
MPCSPARTRHRSCDLSRLHRRRSTPVRSNHFKNLLVDLQAIRWTNPRARKRYICLTPEIVGQALVDFDKATPIEPFSVGLEPMQATEMKRVKNTDGSTSTRPSINNRTLRLKSNGQPVVAGGGHLRPATCAEAATSRGMRQRRARPLSGGIERD